MNRFWLLAYGLTGWMLHHVKTTDPLTWSEAHILGMYGLLLLSATFAILAVAETVRSGEQTKL